MNTPANDSMNPLKIIGFGFFTLVVVVIAVVACWLLLPVYEKPVAQYLEQQATLANDANHNAQAIAYLTQAATLDPKNSLVLNNLAWLLATAPEASSRDGKKALAYALRACDLTNYQEAANVDTLAAAYAETGDFDNAIKWENKYLTSLSQNANDASDGEARLALYQAHKPYHAEQ